MNLNIKGEYYIKVPIVSMFLNEMMVIDGTNIITTLGESFFLRRCIDDTLNPMEYIVIGNDTTMPLKTDLKLGNETKRAPTVKTVDTESGTLTLTANFTKSDIVGITEIGVCNIGASTNEEILISHDTFYETVLTEDFLGGVINTIQVDYIFNFSTSQLKSGWSKASGYDNVYYVYEPNNVVSIMDNTGGYGLRNLNSISAVENTKGSFFYDSLKTSNIYIHLYHNDGEVSPNPNSHEIIVQNK